MTDNTPPKFCPQGCGETLSSKLAIGETLAEMEEHNPQFKNHWTFKCAKCGQEGFISEGLKE